MAAESQFAQLYGASSHNVRLTNDETVSEPLLTSSTFHAQTHTADQPLETDFPAHVDLSPSRPTDLGQTQPLETRVERPLETNFGSHHSVASSLSQAPADLYQYKISYEMTPYSSTLSSLHPVCRICQNPSEKRNVLITPCRCDGTLKHVHGTCLRVMLFKFIRICAVHRYWIAWLYDNAASSTFSDLAIPCRKAMHLKTFYVAKSDWC